MDYSKQLAISYYKTIATLNESHKIYLVQHQPTGKVYVKKVLDVYNKDIFTYLSQNHISGTPHIHELFEEDHQLIVIEDYISGCTLQEKIDIGNIDLDSIYHYTVELCSVLEQLHALNPPIVHRDIKPSNIIITEYNHVVLLDFNAAKRFAKTADNDTVLLGTKGYAAPEQYGFGSSSPKTDIYAIGVLLKELSETLPSESDALCAITERCIQMNPKDRYPSVTELKSALEQAHLPVSPPPSETTKTFSLRSVLLPGYRSLTPWKMLFATFNYLFIIVLCMSLEVEDLSGPQLWLERIFCLLMILSVIFGCFNYLDIQRLLPLCKHKSKLVHYLGIILLDFILFFTLFFLMLVLEVIFF